jgi:hypothetical protein
MSLQMLTRPRTFLAAAALMLGWGLNQAAAGIPDGFPQAWPPFVPPPPTVNEPPPPVITPPPIHNPPPVTNAPEPGTLVLGLIAAGVGGLAARRRKRTG